ncbi:hypothetical protein [Spirochaeta africana]|uniref:Fido domain-containing protein n=1 Tax=Spirochaeta africana (strain ATCC 700263 / DSM 8902 / Z-7692) TaxID=889378 RepID=H9UGU7_SPIAZ|nr:hypothetical protein [Spirochaeta africana]AFG36740.1 hypothetical protein Spiaf_0640 [Spirochaeta africana DSM 8902]
MSRLFDIDTIETDLRGFQRDFAEINDQLAMRREDITDTMVAQIVDAYRFLNELLEKGMDLFTPAGLHALLEMNHIVLCGLDSTTRSQYYHHLNETRKSFLQRIKPIKEWVLKKRDNGNPYKLAAGFYSRMLSQPQLFLEGNHRTGNILLNYLLVSKDADPFVISPATALPYLDLSGDIKFSNKDNSLDANVKLPGHRKRFRVFLEQHSNPRYLCEGGS